MKIAMLVPPFRYGRDPQQWITVPPQGYGGIQWVVANLIDGLLEHGCEVLLAGAPGSPAQAGLTVADAVEPSDVDSALDVFAPDVIHDHSNAALLPHPRPHPTVRTHHLNGQPNCRTNGIYLSRAQRHAAGSVSAPIIRLPVNADRCVYRTAKEEFLLFLGRVSAHKGVWEAAMFARVAGLTLKVAGPAWEKDYLYALLTEFPDTVEYLGEVGGQARAELIAGARAMMVLSQPKGGPFGGEWIEPGATVVSEAAASGTPVIASDNGCLPEICPGVGAVIPVGRALDPGQATRLLAGLPSPTEVRNTAVDRWDHKTIAQAYVRVYERALAGERWT